MGGVANSKCGAVVIALACRQIGPQFKSRPSFKYSLKLYYNINIVRGPHARSFICSQIMTIIEYFEILITDNHIPQALLVCTGRLCTCWYMFFLFSFSIVPISYRSLYCFFSEFRLNKWTQLKRGVRQGLSRLNQIWSRLSR